jgi:hypothetical protein
MKNKWEKEAGKAQYLKKERAAQNNKRLACTKRLLGRELDQVY